MSHVCNHRWNQDGTCVFCGIMPRVPFHPRKRDDRLPPTNPGANVGMMLAASELTKPCVSEWAFDNQLRSLSDAMRRVRK